MSTYPPDQLAAAMPPPMNQMPPPAPAEESVPVPDPAPLSATFLTLTGTEGQYLSDRIQQDYMLAINDHRSRMHKYAHFYSLWRSPIGGPDGAIGKPNYKVPIIEWMLMAKLANVVDSLFGDDAEVIAEPVGPSDQQSAAKIGLYMTWLFFSAMKAKSPLITFLFRSFLFGRAFCWIPYVKQAYEDPSGTEQVEYQGPEFIPLYPDDFIVPAEQVTSLHEFSFVIRRYRETPDDLLRGELEGRYAPGTISDPKNWARIYTAAASNEGRMQAGEEQPVKTVNDGLEGVTYGGQSARHTVEILEWYGRWRMPKGQAGPSASFPDLSIENQQQHVSGETPGLDDWDGREMKETEVVVRRITEIDHIISAQRLVDLYPGIKDRRPFDEMPLMDTGEYWCKGYPEMLIDSAYELTINNNLRTEGGEMSVAPPLGVKTGKGYQFKQGRYGPRQVIELDNPAVDARTLDFRVDLSYTTVQEQALLSYVERLTGISDQTLGRAIDRPNAPRTARGQLALISKGDVRLNLDNTTLREHLSRIMQRIWLIDSSYADDSVFFRVTEEKANGLFASTKGFGEMTAEERGGKYDFKVKFATSSMSKEAEKEKATILFQSALATPLVQQDPRAQWALLDQFFKVMGHADFKAIIPEPPPVDMPMSPTEEWTRMLQGEEVHVHWGDVDDDHITQHRQQLVDQGNSHDPDFAAMKAGGEHIVAHLQQKNAKTAYAVQVAAKQAAVQQVAAHYGIDPAQLSQQYADETGDQMIAPGGPPQGPPGQNSQQQQRQQPPAYGGATGTGQDLEQGLPGIE